MMEWATAQHDNAFSVLMDLCAQSRTYNSSQVKHVVGTASTEHPVGLGP